IHALYADGSTGPLTDPVDGFTAMSWSPDGQDIAAVSDRDGDNEIYALGMDGQNLRQLTRNDLADGMADWSPDGAIAFASVRDGQTSEIIVMDADGGNPRAITE